MLAFVCVCVCHILSALIFQWKLWSNQPSSHWYPDWNTDCDRGWFPSWEFHYHSLPPKCAPWRSNIPVYHYRAGSHRDVVWRLPVGVCICRATVDIGISQELLIQSTWTPSQQSLIMYGFWFLVQCCRVMHTVISPFSLALVFITLHFCRRYPCSCLAETGIFKIYLGIFKFICLRGET